MNVHEIVRSVQIYFRRKRMMQFASIFNISDETKIVDLGGTPHNWAFVPAMPDVKMVNIDDGSSVHPDEINSRYKLVRSPRTEMVLYDGNVVPFSDNSFDICFSNSTIEHVGNYNSIMSFANEIRRLAPRYYVQTPNRHFFFEPHFLCVFVHWLPFSVKRRLLRWLSVWGWVARPDQETIDRTIKEIHLLTYDEMKQLFPDSEIIRERFLGFTKSIIAVKV